MPLSLPLLLLFAAKRVNTEHLLAWEHLLQLRGNFFDTPLFSLILNFLQLNNIETHSLLSSSHYDSIFYRGKKKTNGRLKRCKLYSRRYLKLFSFFNIFLQLCVHTNPIHFKIMCYTFFLIQFIIKKHFMNYIWDLKAHKHVQHEHIVGYMAWTWMSEKQFIFLVWSIVRVSLL